MFIFNIRYNKFYSKQLYSTFKYSFRTINNTSKLDNVSDRINKKDNLYCPKNILIFRENKYNLISSVNSNYIKIFKREEKILHLLLFSSITASLSSFLYGFFKTSIFTAGITLYLLRSIRIIKINSSRIVKCFNLLEDGKTIQIITLKKNFEIDIKHLAKPNKQQSLLFNMHSPEIASMSVPFIVEKGQHKGMYFMPPDVNIESNKEILSAVMNNSYIDLSNRIKSDSIIIE